MPTTLQNLIDEACLLAGVAGLKRDAQAQLLLDQVFTEVGERLASSERTRHQLRRTKPLNVVNGVVQLSDDVLSAYITDSVLSDADDATKNYSYLAPEHFIREPLDSRLGHYSVVGESSLRVLEPGEAYDPLTGPTATYSLTIPCVPEVPTAPANPIVASTEVVDELRTALVRALKAS